MKRSGMNVQATIGAMLTVWLASNTALVALKKDLAL
jgi:hypothetical protein